MKRTFLYITAFMFLLAAFAAPVFAEEKGHDIPDYFVPPPPFSEDIFPCSECHADLDVDTNRRELDFHEGYTAQARGTAEVVS
ncbi:MAG TPA: hypothetical protein ENH31_08275 [Nitrospirae bacterium]|nr:hypothetical protein [Nitrospirota bacterium]HDK82546.1 hypothetical protein [Nitrospirota bacterium]